MGDAMNRGSQTAREAFAKLLQRAVRDGDDLLVGPTDRLVPVRVAGRSLRGERHHKAKLTEA
jgi:hypothetical protein